MGERNEEVRQLRMDGANKLDAEVSTVPTSQPVNIIYKKVTVTCVTWLVKISHTQLSATGVADSLSCWMDLNPNSKICKLDKQYATVPIEADPEF